MGMGNAWSLAFFGETIATVVRSRSVEEDLALLIARAREREKTWLATKSFASQGFGKLAAMTTEPVPDLDAWEKCFGGYRCLYQPKHSEEAGRKGSLWRWEMQAIFLEVHPDQRAIARTWAEEYLKFANGRRVGDPADAAPQTRHSIDVLVAQMEAAITEGLTASLPISIALARAVQDFRNLGALGRATSIRRTEEYAKLVAVWDRFVEMYPYARQDYGDGVKEV